MYYLCMHLSNALTCKYERRSMMCIQHHLPCTSVSMTIINRACWKCYNNASNPNRLIYVLSHSRMIYYTQCKTCFKVSVLNLEKYTFNMFIRVLKQRTCTCFSCCSFIAQEIWCSCFSFSTNLVSDVSPKIDYFFAYLNINILIVLYN